MKRWYVVQVYTGSEEKFKKELVLEASSHGWQDAIGDIVVPKREMALTQDGVDEKVFPGYVMIEVEMTDDLASKVGKVANFVRFVGGVPPVPLSQKEVESLSYVGKKAAPKVDVSVSIKSQVKIVSGPFAGFEAIVEDIDEKNKRLKIVVSIFGRMVPLDVDFGQIEVC